MTVSRSILLAGALAIVPAIASADVSLPCRTAQLIVPWAAGGDTDVVLRAVAEAVTAQGGTPLQVVNVPGQGGNLGAKQAAAAAPDGCTLFAIHQSAITSYLTGRIEFSHEAFDPVALMVSTPAIYGAAADTPFDTLEEMVAYARENPGQLLAGSTLGSTSHFALLLLEDATGASFNHISYEGTRERMTALLSGVIQLAEINLAASAQYITTGELKSLAITSPERHPDVPDVPTAREAGADVLYGTDRGVVLPKGADAEVQAYWVERMRLAAESPEFQERIANLGSTVTFLGGPAYGEYFVETLETWRTIAQTVGVYSPMN